MRVYLIISAMLLISFSHIFANENPSEQRTGANVYGHVVNEQTGEHIPNIVIGLKGTTISTMTDNSGHFSFKHMPLGEHTLLAIGLGYTTVEKPFTSKSNQTTEVEFEMESVIFEREQVVVTANRNQTNKKETATIVNVLSDKQFSRTASSTLAESLNFGTGLRMEYNCSNCGVPQLRINGLNGQYSQILLDSRPIFSSLATVYGLEQLPTAMVERVEIIRGGGSALFGSNAIGGVVNIITKEPLRNSVTIANTTNILNSKTTDINNSMNGSFVSEDRKTGVYVFGMTRERKPYFRDNDDYSEMPELSSETIGFRGFYKTGMYSKITAEYHHIREFRRGGNKLDRPPHEADVAEQLRHQINGGGLKFDAFTPDEHHRVTVFSSAQIIDRDSYFGTSQNLNAYGTTFNRTFVGGGQYTYFMDRLLFSPSELTTGIEYTQDELNDRMLGYDRDLLQFTNTIGGFVQNEWKQEKYNILVGARIDKNKLVDKLIVSPRANIRYSPRDFVGFRASYASGYRAPQAYDEDLHVAAVGGEVALINVAEGLKPEYSHSLSGSVDLYKSLGQVEANLLIEGFYTTLKDVFVLEEMGHDSQNNLLLERRNGSGATVKGINLEAMIGVRSVVELQMGYTFQSSHYKKAEIWVSDPVELSSKQMFRTPNNYGYITANFFVTPKFRAAIFGTHTGHMYVPHFAGYVAENSVKYTPQFFDMGCRLSYAFTFGQSTEVEISGGVKNIFDQYQGDLDKGMARDSKYIYGPSLPRTIFFGIKMSL